jgi:DMSO/TMAO reductase YedYZ molybdopterin-dependent catalytic subunit
MQHLRGSRHDTPLPGPLAGLLGVLATAAALGAGHLVAGVVASHSSPFLAVGNTAIDLTPEAVKAWAIRQFGESDKQVLLLGMAGVILLFAVISGVVSRRGSAPGLTLIGVFGVLGVVAAARRPDLPASGVLAPVIAALTGLAVFWWLHLSAQHMLRARLESDEERAAADRRRFLTTAVGVAAGSGLAGLLGKGLAERVDVESSRQAVGPIVPAQRAPAIPLGADFARAGTPTFLTSTRDFYRVDTALTVPQLQAEGWRLRVHGMVDRELSLTYADLLHHRQVEKTITMTCVSNEVGGPYISTANFTGVPIREVLLQAGVRTGAEQVFSTSVDGFTAGTPVDVLLEPERGALLALGMHGEPLPAEHGFPVRMVTPGLYGYVSATKWLADLELTTFDKVAYWQERGWAQRAPIKTQSRIDRPRAFGKIRPGRTTAAGIAWAQHTGIDKVEVRVDGDPWQRAQLSTEVNVNTWRMWRIDLDLGPGGHTIESRATDRSGYTQTPLRVPPVPDGATGWHSVHCVVR